MIFQRKQILVDANPVDLSAILGQRTPGRNKSQIIAYASRALIDAETRHSQTEKEALAIVLGIEHFNPYIYGAPFMLYTDHKPLELIYGNPMSKLPARIQQYDFSVVYKAGTENPADYLSRTQCTSSQNNIAEEYVNFLAHAAVPNTLTLSEIKEATLQDSTLRALRTTFRAGYWNVDSLKPYRQIKDEITLDHAHNILLRGTRIILPASLQVRVIKLAQEGHRGHSKTTAFLR